MSSTISVIPASPADPAPAPLVLKTHHAERRDAPVSRTNPPALTPPETCLLPCHRFHDRLAQTSDASLGVRVVAAANMHVHAPRSALARPHQLAVQSDELQLPL